ncbi:hypothetical protein [Stenotrophomonas sp. MMGLT7]|uniref:hypothetical protein n=1 Tax=Stenotrophomonas sp. MMGLT7 TaxID=2901227 RepID=UPI001E40D3C3|nr:hypothetical protein [Stenotrophomonas sp. MMGLT7]MCD7097749.1 hypothetical protein [Stenotrophomonas sp. MMGLT7]
METTLNIIGALFFLYVMAAILMFLSYVVFKRPRLKTSLVHLAISLALFCSVVAIEMIRGGLLNAKADEAHEARVAAVDTAQVTPQMADDLARREPEAVAPEQVRQIAELASRPLDDAAKQYLPAIKRYYIYYHSKLAEEKKPEFILGTEFEALRRSADREQQTGN